MVAGAERHVLADSDGGKTLEIPHQVRDEAPFRLEGFGEEAGGGGDEVVAGVTLALELEETEAVEIAVFLLEALAEGADGVAVAGEAADHAHGVDASAGLLESREAATEGSGHGLGLFGGDGKEVGESQDDGLAAVAALLVELAGAGFAGVDFGGGHGSPKFFWGVTNLGGGCCRG